MRTDRFGMRRTLAAVLLALGLLARPGITGMWQVSGRSDAAIDDYTRLDLYYVDNWSLLTDLVIVLETIPVVLFGRGAY